MGHYVRTSRPLIIPLCIFCFTSWPALAQGPKKASATKTAIDGPSTLVLDNEGHLFVDELWGNRVWRIDLRTNTISIVAGNGKECCYKEGVGATEVGIESPVTLAVDFSGRLFIGDQANVRRVDLRSGLISTVAGDGKSGDTLEGALVLSTSFRRIAGLAFNSEREMFIADDIQGKVFKVDGRTGRVLRVVGNGKQGFAGDGGSALNATFRFIESIAFDAADNLLIADSENCGVRRVDRQTGVINTIAVTGGPKQGCPPPPGTNMAMPSTRDLALSSTGDIYFLEPAFDVVARVDPKSQTPSIVFESAGRGFAGDGGPVTAAQFDGFSGLAIDPEGNLFVSDCNNKRVRRVDARAGAITTVAGNGLPHTIHAQE